MHALVAHAEADYYVATVVVNHFVVSIQQIVGGVSANRSAYDLERTLRQLAVEARREQCAVLICISVVAVGALPIADRRAEGRDFEFVDGRIDGPLVSIHVQLHVVGSLVDADILGAEALGRHGNGGPRACQASHGQILVIVEEEIEVLGVEILVRHVGKAHVALEDATAHIRDAGRAGHDVALHLQHHGRQRDGFGLSIDADSHYVFLLYKDGIGIIAGRQHSVRQSDVQGAALRRGALDCHTSRSDTHIRLEDAVRDTDR